MAPIAPFGASGSRRPAVLNAPNWSIPSLSISRFLEREGLLERDAENSYLAGDAADEEPEANRYGLMERRNHPLDTR